MKYLTIILKGPLQYYAPKNHIPNGVTGPYYKTLKFPSKKAVVGMIGATLGVPHESKEFWDLYDELDVKYKVTHRGSVLVDFQTIGSDDGYLPTVDGGKKEANGVKRVEYLQDYAFEAYVGASDERLKQIFDGFCNPIYLPYLGKRCCFHNHPFVTTFKLISEEELEETLHVHDCP